MNSRGMGEMLKGDDVRADLTSRMQSALDQARSSAPVASGAYRDSLRIEQATTDRVAVRIVSDVPHALVVEANTGNLARALDAAGGS